MRILLVEDDPMVGAAVRKGMQQDGHTVDWVGDAGAAEAALGAGAFEFMLLDLGLPGKSGFELLAALRRAANPLPVIVCTARDAVDDRVRGLDLGADDYLVKPFALDELSARIRAVMRRRLGQAGGLLRYGPLALDPATHEVFLHGQPVALSGREFAILEALMERPTAVLSRARIEERLYGWDEEVASNAVEVHIHKLRRKLGEGTIRTVRGLGYSLGRES
jgi:two-component system, OmpR family, response regulator QseB